MRQGKQKDENEETDIKEDMYQFLYPQVLKHILRQLVET